MTPTDDQLDYSYEEIAGYQPCFCAFCGEENEVFVDASAPGQQQFTEDCDVCCRPNLIDITVDYNGFITVQTTQEYEA